MIGRVYKITNEDESIVYIGSSSMSLSKRWNCHKNDFKRWIGGKKLNRCSIYNHFQEHGIDNFSIHLISEHEIETKRQLLEFEQLVIDRTNCVNEAKAFSPLTRQDRDRAYYEANKESKLEYNLNYYELNKEQLKERQRTYNRNNKELLKARSAERIDCGCGSNVRRGDKAIHQRSQKHQRWFETQQG
jgi:hypothetical protein